MNLNRISRDEETIFSTFTLMSTCGDHSLLLSLMGLGSSSRFALLESMFISGLQILP